MPVVSLNLRCIDYCSDKNTVVSACRTSAHCDFVTQSATKVFFSCLVNTGAPFSVLPYSLWHDRNLQWTRCGSQLRRQPGRSFEPLQWQGVSCSLGETSVYIFDQGTSALAGPFAVVGKFVNSRIPDARLEMTAVLGLNFLADNRLRLTVDGITGSLTSNLVVP
jgi:hypothetical protein